MKPATAAVATQTRHEIVRTALICFLFIVSALVLCKNVSSADPLAEGKNKVSESAADKKDSAKAETKVATFAGGCFWCTEAVFERLDGVSEVLSGYIGGTVPNPTYEQVCAKTTGHAEAIEIVYDPAKISYEEMLEIFFKTHDPTTLNRQGNDSGPQYRSSVFYHDEAQKKAAEKYIDKLNQSGDYKNKIVTLTEKATTFYPAEEYHQDFYRKNPNYGYCRAIVADKVRKVNRNFGDKLKK